VSIPGKGRKSWYLAAIDANEGQELGRVDLGWRNPQDPKYYAQFARESEDGRFLHALDLVKGTWGLVTVRLEDFEPVSRLALDKGHPTVRSITPNRVAVSTEHQQSNFDVLRLLDTDTGAILSEQTYRETRDFGLQVSADKAELYAVSGRKFAYAIDERSLRRKYTSKANLDIFSVSDGTLKTTIDLGYNPSAIAAAIGGDEGRYVLSTADPLGTEASLWRMRGDQVAKIASFPVTRCSQNSLVVVEKHDLAVVACREQISILSLSSGQIKGQLKAKLRMSHGMVSDDGRFLFLREAEGSEVALVDLSSMSLLGKSGSGSAGRKFGAIMFSAAGIAAAAWTGFGFVTTFDFSDTAMLLDNNQTNVYVLNRGTQDVSIYNLEQLERTATIFLPGAPFAVSRFPDSRFVFGLAERAVVAIDDVTHEAAAEWTDGYFAGADGKFNELYYGTKQGLKIIDMATLKERMHLSALPGARQVVSFGKPSDSPY
jgi:hypothetical protein